MCGQVFGITVFSLTVPAEPIHSRRFNRLLADDFPFVGPHHEEVVASMDLEASWAEFRHISSYKRGQGFTLEGEIYNRLGENLGKFNSAFSGLRGPQERDSGIHSRESHLSHLCRPAFRNCWWT